MRTRYLLLSLVIVILAVSCATAPPAPEPEPVTETPAKPAPAEPAPAPAKPAPAPVEVTPPPAPAVSATKWQAVEMQIRLNDRPYQIPAEFRNNRVIGTIGERDLTIEMPSMSFTIYATYEPAGKDLYRVTPVRYVNVPAGIQEFAILAEKEIGGPLPKDYYFELSQQRGKAVIEAEALGFSLSWTWTILE